MTRQPSDIPLHVTMEELEQALDRLAEEIVVRGDKAVGLLALYAWLENQIEKRKHNHSIFEAARSRVQARTVRLP